MIEKPRDVLSYTAKLPRYDGAADQAPLLIPAWVRAGGAAFAISIDQLAALVGSAPTAPAAPTPAGLLPSGGNEGQFLVKTGPADYATGWATIIPIPAGGTTGQVLAKASDFDRDTTWVTAGGGAGGTATVTVPNARYEHSETITATGVTPTSRVTLALGLMDDQAQNSADMLDIASMGAVPGTNQITVQMSFSTPTSGPIPINWSAA
jgi:hypothetical protein